MNAIKIILPVFISVFLFSCGAKTPKQMAKEYCDCFLAAEDDESKLKSCQELAKEHKEKLGKDQQSQQIYASEIIRCAVYEQP